jgi:hypothetical protein
MSTAESGVLTQCLPRSGGWWWEFAGGGELRWEDTGKDRHLGMHYGRCKMQVLTHCDEPSMPCLHVICSLGCKEFLAGDSLFHRSVQLMHAVWNRAPSGRGRLVLPEVPEQKKVSRPQVEDRATHSSRRRREVSWWEDRL